MGDPTFGISLRSRDEEARPVLAADLSTIGLIGPADDADALLFPLDTPVLVNSNDVTKTSKVGANGYLSDAIRGINDQLGETQFAARLVIVRTARGADVDPAIALQQTIANIVGDSIDGTGLYAFLQSATELSVTPRLIAAPGYTGQMANGVGTITRTDPGSSYVTDQTYPITFSGGGASPAIIQAVGHAVGQSDGSLGPVILDTPGAWLESAPTVTAPPAARHVTAGAVAAAGTGYAVGNTITLGNGVVATVATITGGGGTGPVGTVTISTPGSYSGTGALPTNPVAQVTSNGAGTGATFNLTWVNTGTVATYTATVVEGANPVCASLTGVLNSLLGHAVVESGGISQDNDNDWRETIQSKRLIPISGGCRVLDPDTQDIVFKPLAPRILGIAVRRDHETGAPFHSWANQPVQGIIGPNRSIPFVLTDDANEAQELLKNNIGVLVRGQVGDDFAIASGGFVFIGTDNAGEDELWRFYNVTRGRDFILLGMLRSMRYYLGRYNITGHTIRAILNAMSFFLRDLKADDHILGYRVQFRPEGNSADEIRLGHVVVTFAAEEPPVLRHLTIEHSRYRPAIDAMVADLAAQLNLAVT